MSLSPVDGVDGCKAGRVYVASTGDAGLSAFIARSSDTRVSQWSGDCLIGTDIPIGLPTDGTRHEPVKSARSSGNRRALHLPAAQSIRLGTAPLH